jgi:hypothetical protein
MIAAHVVSVSGALCPKTFISAIRYFGKYKTMWRKLNRPRIQIRGITIQPRLYNERMPPAYNTPKKKEPAGPIVGAIIILLLMIVGGFYFWREQAARPNPNANIPYIPAGNSTTTTE